MLPTPKKYFVTAGASEGTTKMNAFDNALLQARIGNINLLRVSSILPPEASYDPSLVLPPGSLVPTAYGYIHSCQPGELIAAAVGVGIDRTNHFGVIMEFSGRCSREEAVAQVEAMLREAFAVRGMELNEMKTAGAEHRVVANGCALAAVPMWY
jgi:arginine decarboxylase